MASDVEVQNAPAIMADDEEAVQNPKGESGDGKEIHGRDSFPMIAQKGQPALGGLRDLGRSFHPAGNGSFRHLEADHQEFAMDARRTPTGIVSDHLKDQFTDLLGDPVATAHWFSHFAEHGPVQFEPGSMPACDGVRQDDNECLFPLGPEPASYDPEEFVDDSQPWPRCWRLKTASCWRRARFSSIRLRRVRNPRSTAPSQSRNRSNMATKL